MNRKIAAALSVTAAVMMMGPLAQAETNSLEVKRQTVRETIQEMARNHPDKVRILADQEDFAVEFMSTVTNLCLGVTDEATENGDPVTQVSCGTDAARLIIPDPDSEETETALVIAQNRKCLDIPDGDTNNGVLLQQWDCDDVPQQRFSFADTQEQTFAILPAHTLNNPDTEPKCLIAEGGRARSGAVIQDECLDNEGNVVASARFMAYQVA